jgi:Flp pilus assembly pilin Flp
MIKHHRHPKNQARTARLGITTAEYALLIGLIGIVSIIGLKNLGFSTHSLFANANTTLAERGTLGLLDAPASSGGNSAIAYKMATDPATGKIFFQLPGGTESMATNLTSVGGDRLNSLGTTMIGNKLAQLAETETDPELKNYYAKLAELSFYLGGAEGELDDVPGMAPFGDKYTNADALRDIITLGKEMSDLLNNPPANFNQASFNEVMPLAAEVYNIAQNYKNTLSEYIAPDGVTTKTFEPTSMLSKLLPILFPSSSGNGEPGSVLSKNGIEPGSIQKSYTPYSSLMSYDQVKNLSAKVLSDHKVQSVPVETTLTNATEIDKAASGSNTTPKQ